GQVAFDTQEFVETLENAGLPKDQARAISIAVRKSHEVADVATRRDLEDARKDIDAGFQKGIARFEKHEAQMQSRFEKVDNQITEVKKDLSAEIAEVCKNTAARFEKVDAQIAEARKDTAAQFEKTDAKIAEVRKDLAFDIADARKEAAADMALLRKDVESLTNKMIIKMASIMVGAIGVATAIIKLL
ncbi:DUF1640 domain-containing protein, partial [Candidatus Sodalis sp. SoCistrobi]|uniref:DUF1640 domain-containing protein n=1 Tax=Candidatus Sodalis sp. SoCistrobi TaxID=1922216 RepID=UPI00093A82C7